MKKCILLSTIFLMMQPGKLPFLMMQPGEVSARETRLNLIWRKIRYRNIFSAILSNNIEAVKQFLASDTNANLEDKYFHTPLYYAAWEGYNDIVQLLLDANADPNKANTELKNTPLHVAAWKGYSDIVKMLLAANANPNLAAENDETQLHYAVRQGYSEIVKMLLAANADPNLTGKDGITPLHRAAREGKTEIVKMLLAANADPKLFDEHGLAPLHRAAREGKTEIVQTLLGANTDTNLVDKQGLTALHHAIWHGHINIVKMLLAAKANPDLAYNDGETPLYKAVNGILNPRYSVNDNNFSRNYNGDPKLMYNLMQTLLDFGANPNLANKYGEIPLHKAIDFVNYNLVQRLLIARTDPNLANKDGDTPLHKAAQYNSKDKTQLLLAAGADPNLADKWGNTPLHDAARAYAYPDDKVFIMKILISALADPQAKNKDGQTPLDLAKDKLTVSVYERHIMAEIEKLKNRTDAIDLIDPENSAKPYFVPTKTAIEHSIHPLTSGRLFKLSVLASFRYWQRKKLSTKEFNNALITALENPTISKADALKLFELQGEELSDTQVAQFPDTINTNELSKVIK